MIFKTRPFRRFFPCNSGRTLALFAILLLSGPPFFGCASSRNYSYSDSPDCEPATEICVHPLIASMPPPIDHDILRLAVLPMNANEASGLSSSLQREMSAKVEAGVQILKSQFPRLTIVERERLELALRELKFQASGHVRDDHFVGAGRMLGADHIFTYQASVGFTNDASRRTPGYPSDATEFGLRGGTMRAFTQGKVIHVETGAVVFQQTSEQSMEFPRPHGASYWNNSTLDQNQRWLVGHALEGLFQALDAALDPSPDGTVISREKGGDRVIVDFVLHGGPAFLAGLQQGDIITAIDGIPIIGIGDSVLTNLDKTPAELHRYTIQRKGREQTLVVRLRARKSIERSSSLADKPQVSMARNGFPSPETVPKPVLLTR